MNSQNFRTKDLAIEFYRECKATKVPYYAKAQLLRAALSIPLNLGEGSSKRSFRDKIRFYEIALCSLREVQTLIEAEDLEPLKNKADLLGACLFKLVHQRQPGQ